MTRRRFSTAASRMRRAPPLIAPLGPRGLVYALGAAVGVLLLPYLLTGNLLLLALGLLAAIAGAAYALRGHPAGVLRGATGTALYVFVPALATTGTALYLRGLTSGVGSVPAAAVAGVVFAVATRSEYVTVDAAPDTYGAARLVLSLISYVTAFALFLVVFTAEVPLSVATLIVAVVALLLSMDILRDLEGDTATLFAYAGVCAIVVAEVCWALYYLALKDLIAPAFLLVTFYEVTGLIQSYLTGHFDRRTVAEYVVVGALGLLIITAGNMLSRSV